ncbi:MAG: bis(5'-nucleosyl)-tetraphosphatase (symmetrical) YqeK [Syntrophomonas sp.]
MLAEQEAINVIKSRLSRNRFEHSLRVAQVAGDLAEKYGQNKEKARLTGILHDYAKGMSSPELLSLAEENHLICDELDRQLPDLLHGPVGAVLVNKQLGIEDGEILKAISLHTMGSTHMSLMDKIIFLADMIEPGRDYPGMERLACLVFRDLDEGMLYGLESTIKYCLDQRRILHPQTIAVRNHFLKLLGGPGHEGC